MFIPKDQKEVTYLIVVALLNSSSGLLFHRCLQVDSWRIIRGGDDKTLKVRQTFPPIYSHYTMASTKWVFVRNTSKT